MDGYQASASQATDCSVRAHDRSLTEGVSPRRFFVIQHREVEVTGEAEESQKERHLRESDEVRARHQ